MIKINHLSEGKGGFQHDPNACPVREMCAV